MSCRPEKFQDLRFLRIWSEFIPVCLIPLLAGVASNDAQKLIQFPFGSLQTGILLNRTIQPVHLHAFVRFSAFIQLQRSPHQLLLYQLHVYEDY
jgi:hypothetical protein